MTTSKITPAETIPAAEANRRFSELLRGVREEGRRYIVTSHGRAVAQIGPAQTAEEADARTAAWKALEQHLRATHGVPIEPWTREELYERSRS